MQVSKLLVSNLSITEDEYSFGGSFVLSDGNKSLKVDISDMEDNNKLEGIKSFFELEDENADIRNYLMKEIIDKSSIGSRIKEGEGFQESSKESDKKANCLDLA